MKKQEKQKIKKPPEGKVSKKKIKTVRTKEKIPEKNLITIAELSKKTHIEIRTLRNVQQQGIIEPETKSKGKESLYDYPKCLAALFSYAWEKLKSRRSLDSEEMAKEKLSREGIKRELEALKLAELKGELHRSEDIEKVMGLLLSRLRINLLAIPLGVAPIIKDLTDASEIAEIIDERIRRAMNEVVDLDLDELIAKEK